MPRAALAACLSVLVALPAPAAAPPPTEQWIVVTAPAFRAALAPLLEHRRSQLMRVVVLDASRLATAEKIRARLRQLCRDHAGASYVLLVGAPSGVGSFSPVQGTGTASFSPVQGTGSGPRPERIVVPSLKGAAGRMKGEPTDLAYGCPDAHGPPSVPVGRLPARTEAEARGMVQKILAMEREQKPGLWKRRLTVLAGIPAYNPLVDRLVENLALGRFDRLHPAWTGRAVYTNPLSRFCLPDSLLRKRSLAYLEEGQAFTLYLGHSSAEGLYGGPTAAFLDRSDWRRLAVPTGAGVFVTFGCNGCQLRGPDGEGYGVTAIRNPRGPAAVLGSQGICFASMVQLAADGLFRRSFQGPLPRRLGACWLAVLEGIARGRIDFLAYRMLDAVDGDSRIPQAVQRREHLEMFVLLGDPALRLPEMPADVRLAKLPALAAGKPFAVGGTLPARLAGARVRITLERSPASLPAGLAPAPRQPGKARDGILLANHEKANAFAVCAEEVKAKAGAFAARLRVPEKLSWPKLVLRVYARTQQNESMVVQPLNVTRP
jgi:hypothetical protein